MFEITTLVRVPARVEPVERLAQGIDTCTVTPPDAGRVKFCVTNWIDGSPPPIPHCGLEPVPDVGVHTNPPVVAPNREALSGVTWIAYAMLTVSGPADTGCGLPLAMGEHSPG
jgi:hypothetical protein